MLGTETTQNNETRFFTNDFNNKLINGLPVIFYVYHVTDDNVILKRWNKKHVTELGYSDEELMNISGSVFYTKKEFARIKAAIETLFKNGTAAIHTTLITKDGKYIPFCLRGYVISIDDDEKYFMGIGVNESEQVQLKKQLNKAEKEKQFEAGEKYKAKDLLNLKERELLTMVINESYTTKIINDARKKIEALQKKHTGKEIINDLKEIDKILFQKTFNNNQWDVFKLRFKEIYPEFFSKLKKKHPEITQGELRFCAYLRVHLSGHQIAAILNISKEGIKKTRYRIRKKFGLQRQQSLEDYIMMY